MKILLLNQCFYPDVMATGLQLTDLAVGLVEEGHEVTVVTSDRGYDNPEKRFPRREVWNGINIIRIPSLALGKGSRWRRAANFASFLVNCALRLLTMRKFDVVVALTSPPLISFLGALFVRLKGGKFFFWVMDLNPDEAIAAGWLKASSYPARMLSYFLQYSLDHATGVIALDQFMKQRIAAKGVADTKITVLPPWARDVEFNSEGRKAFRQQHNLDDSFVVMYAGNHSPCHPLDTLLEAARVLSNEQVAFCFVGGGSEHGRVKRFAADNSLTNIHCLPYQPSSELAATLSAADLHTVVMGQDFVGIVHPSKVYNVLMVGSPLLYIGPSVSHVTALAERLNGKVRTYSATHGDVHAVVKHIRAAKVEQALRSDLPSEIRNSFSLQNLRPKMIDLLTCYVPPPAEVASSESIGYVSVSR